MSGALEAWIRECVARPVYMSIDGIVWKGPCLLVGYVVSAVSDDGYAQLFDGVNGSFSQKYKITCKAGDRAEKSMRYPVYFENGLYVDFDDTNTVGTFEIVGLPF
jgi:hypothetical protein